MNEFKKKRKYLKIQGVIRVVNKKTNLRKKRERVLCGFSNWLSVQGLQETNFWFSLFQSFVFPKRTYYNFQPVVQSEGLS